MSNAAGFDPSGAPLAAQPPFNQSAMSRGFYTFKADGTGSASADVLTISTGNATRTLLTGAVVEIVVQIRLVGGVRTEVRTPRICNRQTTLTKMAD